MSGCWAPLCQSKVPRGWSGERFHLSGNIKQCNEYSGARKDARVTMGHKEEQKHLWVDLGRERLAKIKTIATVCSQTDIPLSS